MFWEYFFLACQPFSVTQLYRRSYIPKVAVLDWDLKEIICVVPYAKWPRRGELLHQANDLILKHARLRPQQQLTELPILTGMPSPTPQQPKPLPK